MTDHDELDGLAHLDGRPRSEVVAHYRRRWPLYDRFHAIIERDGRPDMPITASGALRGNDVHAVVSQALAELGRPSDMLAAMMGYAFIRQLDEEIGSLAAATAPSLTGELVGYFCQWDDHLITPEEWAEFSEEDRAAHAAELADRVPDEVLPEILRLAMPSLLAHVIGEDDKARRKLRLVDHWPTDDGEPRPWDANRFATAALGGDEIPENAARAKRWLKGLVTDAIGPDGAASVLPADDGDDLVAELKAARGELERLDTGLSAEVAAEADRQLRFWSPRGISDLTDEEFTARLTGQIDAVRVRARREDRVALVPVSSGEPAIDLFGYGRAPVVLEAYDADGGHRPDLSWAWGHEMALALGWDLAEFEKWARQQEASDLRQQRDADEEDGAIGWQCLSHLPMGVNVWGGEDSSADHYDENGTMSGPILRYWVDLWLVRCDRIMSLMMSGPWGKEFFKAARPFMAHGFIQSGLAETLGGVKSVVAGEDGSLTEGPSLAEAIAEDTDGLTEQEARDRAFRGPVAPTDEDGAK